MVSYVTIGRNIKAARERLGLTQADVAAALSISVFYYGKFERGAVKQSVERLSQLSELLSVPMEAFFAGSMPPMKYKNRPPTDNAETEISQILIACDEQRRDLILQIAASIAHLR